MWECYNLKAVYVGDKWTMENILSSPYMFHARSALVGGNSTVYNSSKTNGSYAHVDVEGNPGYFTRINDKPVTDPVD
jgi:hypothetical protein